METIAVLAAFLAVVVAFPQRRQEQPHWQQPGGGEVVLLRSTPLHNTGGQDYRFGYELSDGQVRDETGQVEARGSEDAVLRVRGSYSFVSDDGQTYTVNYVADENGFQPQGAHLPGGSNEFH